MANRERGVDVEVVVGDKALAAWRSYQLGEFDEAREAASPWPPW